ncbi:hypothetical protein [Psychrobacillus sp. FSL K6-1464]
MAMHAAWRSRIYLIHGSKIPKGKDLLQVFLEAYAFTWSHEPFSEKKKVYEWFKEEAEDYPHWLQTRENEWWAYHLLTMLAFAKQDKAQLAQNIIQRMLNDVPTDEVSICYEVNNISGLLRSSFNIPFMPRMSYQHAFETDASMADDGGVSESILGSMKVGLKGLKKVLPVEKMETSEIEPFLKPNIDSNNLKYEIINELLIKRTLSWLMAPEWKDMSVEEKSEKMDEEVEVYVFTLLKPEIEEKLFENVFAVLREVVRPIEEIDSPA